jgi:hypothetical protein
MKKLLADIMGQAFAATSGYTPEADDIVEICDDWEIQLATDASEAYLGIVELVSGYDIDQNVTVRTRFTDLRELEASGTITAGDKLVPAGSNTVRTYVFDTDSDHSVLGIACEGAENGETFHALTY